MSIKLTEQSFVVRRSYLSTRSSHVVHQIVHVSRLDETLNRFVHMYGCMCVCVLSNTRFSLSLQNPLHFTRLNGFKLLQEDTLYFYFFLRSASRMLLLQCQWRPSNNSLDVAALLFLSYVHAKSIHHRQCFCVLFPTRSSLFAAYAGRLLSLNSPM